VLHKLHIKHIGKSSESEQEAISILKAGKLEDQNAIKCQKILFPEDQAQSFNWTGSFFAILIK